MKKILFVDDEPNVLAAFERQLRKEFQVETALGALAGLEALKHKDRFAVVVADMRMPEMNGVAFLSRVKELAPDVVRMMLTGNADQATAMEAINQGNIFRFLSKPCSPEKLTQALTVGLRQHELITAEHELLESTLLGSVKALTRILSLAQPKFSSHAERLKDHIRRLAAAMGLANVWELEAAAMLAEIGSVTIPPEVLLKARAGHALSAPEHQMLEQLPEVGATLLAQIPRLEGVSAMILYQKKCFDGRGFPDDSIIGTAIPQGARMLKILFDLAELEAKGATPVDALEQLSARTGWYDPEILATLASCLLSPSDEPAPAPKEVLSVPFANVRVGHLLRSDVETKDGILVVPAGHRVTPASIQRLRNFASLSGVKEPILVEV